MASATAPPTPVSISSKTSVGAEPRSASTTLSASRKRASSPPEATFISGPGRVPGLVQPRTRRGRCRAARRFRLGRDLGREFRAFELERLQLGIDRLVELVGSLAPRRRERAGSRRDSARWPHAPPLPVPRDVRRRHRSEPDRRHDGSASALSPSSGDVVFARRPRAARTAAPRSARARADRDRQRAAPLPDARAPPRAQKARRRAPSRPARSSAGACAARRSSRRTAAAKAGTGDCPPATASCASRRSPATFSACHHGGAPLGQRGFFRRLRRQPASIPRRHGAASRLRAARVRCRRDGPATSASRARRSSHSCATAWRIAVEAAEGIEQRRGASPASTSARSSCWPWISTSAAPRLLQDLRARPADR